MNLTPRQRDVYEAILVYYAAHGHAPSIRDLCDAMGIASPNGIACHLKPLRKKGVLAPAADGAKARCIEVPAIQDAVKRLATKLLGAV